MRTNLSRILANAAFSLSLLAQENGSDLSGTLTDSFRHPAPNVSVTLSSIERVLQTKSSASGQFRFQGVPPGTYDLEFAHPGFVKQKIPVDLPSGSAQSLPVVLQVAGMPNMDYCGDHPSVTYEPPELDSLRLAGVVRDYENREPMVRAELAIGREDDAGTGFTGVSDGKGRFTFDGLPAGRYHLRVSRRGYVPTDVTPLLVPRENRVFIEIPIVKDDKKTIICQ